MVSEDKTKVQFVRKASKLDILLSEIIVLSFAIIGGGFFTGLVLLTFPTSNFGIFLILWLFFPILLSILAVCRNRILERLFRKLSHDGVYDFAVFWKYTFPLFVIAFSLFLGLFAFRELIFLLFSLTFAFLCIPLYFIFEYPLTNEGAIQILFEGLFSSINNFVRRQYYWKKISIIIERVLRIGNIQVSSNALIFYFNKKLLETNENISDDLRNIQAWMSGEQRTGLDSIKRIFPEVEIKPYTKIPFLRRVFGNPTPIQASLIKFFASWIFFIVILVIVLTSHPELLKDILKSLGLP